MQIAIFRRAWAVWLAGLAMLAAAGWWYSHDTPDRHVAAAAFSDKAVNAAHSFAKLPLAFEPNQGQSDPRVLFLSRNAGSTLFLTAEEAVVSLRGAARPLRLAWQGGNPHPQVMGLDSLPGKRNYLKGSDPARWHRDIPTYGKVRYRDLYPGIDLVYYGRQQHLEYDLVVAPGADPTQIRLRLAGMDTVNLDERGALQLYIADRALSLSKPVIYQETADGKKVVDGGYVLLADNQVGLKLAAYDTGRPLIIDPVLTYSTYLGGSGAELGRGVAVDSAKNVYVVGQTASGDFPVTAGVIQNSNAGGNADVFVAKFDPNGSLLFATYFGGSGQDRGFAIAVDAAAVYIAGDTDSTSTSFPVSAGAEQPNKGGNSADIDAFVAKLSKDGSTLLYATYLGGSQAEEAMGIAVDATGNAYVAGATLSSNFPFTLGTFNAGVSGNNCDDPSSPGSAIPCSDAFVVKYDASGAKQYATFLGGNREDAANAIAVTGTGEVYLTGITYSFANFSTGGSIQPTFGGGAGDAFLITLDNAGALTYATYLGGDGWDQGQAIALDGRGDVYIAGVTQSSSGTLPLTNPLQAVYGGGTSDAFVAKITLPNSMKYFTYLGGAEQDFAFGIAVDGSNNAFVVGETMSTNFPVGTALQSTWFGGGNNQWGDAFISKISAPSGFPLLVWSTYLGGGDDDWANGVALDGNGGIYVAGTSFSPDFPTASPYQAGAGGNGDAILFKLNDSNVTADLQVGVSGTPDLVGTGETITYTVVVNNLSATDSAGGVVVRATLPSGVTYQSATPANNCAAIVAQVTCKLGDIPAGSSATTTLTAVNNTAGDITFTAQVVRANQPDNNTSNDSASVTTKAAVGSSGGGAWSLFEWVVGMMVYLARRRRGAILRVS